MRVRLLILGLIVVALTGCGSKTKTYPVSGTVTFNGQKLKDGHILFQPVDGGVGDAGTITDGVFNFQAKAGKVKVEIRATREEGQVVEVMGARNRVQYIPERYNDKTILEAEVVPDGENRFEFPLKDTP